MKRIDVAVGILIDQHGRCLVGQRLVQDQYYAKWEFPGGKLENGETSEEALVREFEEELGIQVEQSEHFVTIEHNYPDRKVRLYVHLIPKYQGEPVGMEGQAIRWVNQEEFKGLDFLEGNKEITNRLMSHLAWESDTS